MYEVLPLLYLMVEIDIMFCLWLIARVLPGFTLCITVVSYFLTIAPLSPWFTLSFPPPLRPFGLISVESTPPRRFVSFSPLRAPCLSYPVLGLTPERGR